MQVTAKANFIANHVIGYSGKTLSQDEIAAIEPMLDHLTTRGLIEVILDQAPSVQEEPEEIIEEKPKKKRRK